MMTDNRLGPFETDVLSVLMEHPRDAYGLKIAEWIGEKTKRIPSGGSVYTTLERLEKKGFVTSYWGEASPVRGGRRKRLFRISAAGQIALRSAPSTTSVFEFNDLVKGGVTI